MGMLLMVSSLLLSACTHDSDSTLPAPAGKVTLTVKVRAADAATRASLDETTAATSPWYWSEGDKLCVVDPAGGVVGYLAIDDAYSDATPATSALFSGTVSSDNIKNGVTYRFWYMGSGATDLSTGTTTVTIDLSSQAGTLAGIYAKNIMTGTAMAYVEGTTAYAADLTLSPQLSIAHFALTNSITATSLTIGGTGVCNSITYNLATGVATATAAGSIALTDATNHFTDVYATFVPGTLTPVFTVASSTAKYQGTLPKTIFAAGHLYRQSATGSTNAVKVYCNKNRTGTLSGLFSISATKKVYFSQGNLQYQASTVTWSFASNQYDYIGDAAGNTTAEADRATQSDWIDLFGWGTSGYNNQYPPYKVSGSPDTFGPSYVSGGTANDIAGTNYDWGVYNPISNGGNRAGLWRTLTKDEWTYLLFTRNNNAAYAGTGKYLSFLCRLTISSTTYRGLMVLPDNNSTNVQTSTYEDDSDDDWSLCPEFTSIPEGALFLPASGYRINVSLSRVAMDGNYWASTSGDDAGNVRGVEFSYDLISDDNDIPRNCGCSVRLVQDE